MLYLDDSDLQRSPCRWGRFDESNWLQGRFRTHPLLHGIVVVRVQ